MDEPNQRKHSVDKAAVDSHLLGAQLFHDQVSTRIDI